MRPSEFFDTSKVILIRAGTRADDHDQLAKFFRDLSTGIEGMRRLADEEGITEERVKDLLYYSTGVHTDAEERAHPAEVKKQDHERVSLAGRLRVILDEGPIQVPELLKRLGITEDRLPAIVGLLGCREWNDPGVGGLAVIGWARDLREVAKARIDTGKLASDVAQELGVEMSVLVKVLQAPR